MLPPCQQGLQYTTLIKQEKILYKDNYRGSLSTLICISLIYKNILIPTLTSKPFSCSVSI